VVGAKDTKDGAGVSWFGEPTQVVVLQSITTGQMTEAAKSNQGTCSNGAIHDWVVQVHWTGGGFLLGRSTFGRSSGAWHVERFNKLRGGGGDRARKEQRKKNGLIYLFCQVEKMRETVGKSFHGSRNGFIVVERGSGDGPPVCVEEMHSGGVSGP